MRSTAIRWPEALEALGRKDARERSAGSRALLAEGLALAALATPDYAVGRSYLNGAGRLEPLNPLHDVRRAMHELRFGQWRAAAELLETLEQRLPEAARVKCLRALALLQSDDPDDAKKAGNIAEAVSTGKVAGEATLTLARFLHFEARARVQFRGAESRLAALEKEPGSRLALADQLLKLLSLHPQEAAPTVSKRVQPGGSLHDGPEGELVRTALAWQKLPANEATAEVERCRPGSARQRFALATLAARTESRYAPELLAALQRSSVAARSEPASRRWFAALGVRRASAEASAERFADALRVIERCLDAEPYESVHYQNRAAALTLMGDHEGALSAWADFDRHQYRLALLGRVDAPAARALLRSHRMFAQQARLTPKGRGDFGIFREQALADSGDSARLCVNQARLDADPEQLRQWIHHSAAELAFSHVVLGASAERFLLQPESARQAKDRCEGLASLVESLSVLVPGEGALLGRAILESWRHAAVELGPRYASGGSAPDLDALRALQHETMADLALLAFDYEPARGQRDALNELVTLGLALAPFFDERVLYQLLDDKSRPASTPLRLLAAHVRRRHGGDDERPMLGAAQRRSVVPALCSSLLVSFSLAQAEEDVERALVTMDRARELDDGSPVLELHAARLLTAANYLDEARGALTRLQRLAGTGDERLLELGEQLSQTLQGKLSRAEVGRTRDSATPQQDLVSGVSDLEADVLRAPAAIHAYEALSLSLMRQARYEDAANWAEQAMKRCLTRQGQLRARGLHLEVLALGALAPTLADSVKLYHAGVREPLFRSLDSKLSQVGEPAQVAYPIHYLHATCLLAENRPREATLAFARALAGCTRPAHQGLLRVLEADADGVYFERSSAAIKSALMVPNLAEAVSLTCTALQASERKQRFLLLLAQLSYEAALVAFDLPPELPAAAAGVDWAARLEAAFEEHDAFTRTERLCELAGELWVDAAAEAASIAKRSAHARGRRAQAAALSRVSSALQADDVTGALAGLDALQRDCADDPQWLRLRVIALLRAERFAEADDTLARLSASSHPDAQDLIEQYPKLRVRYRVSSAVRLVRQRQLDAALGVLEGVRVDDQAARLDLVYTRSFVLARLAEQAQGSGDIEKARGHWLAAIDGLTPELAAARSVQRTDLLDLYGHLDDELARTEGPGGT